MPKAVLESGIINQHKDAQLGIIKKLVQLVKKYLFT
jgi:hypothetical protein